MSQVSGDRVLIFNGKVLRLTQPQAAYWDTITTDGRRIAAPDAHLQKARNLLLSPTTVVATMIKARLERAANEFPSLRCMFEATQVQDVAALKNGERLPRQDEAVALDLFFIRYAGFNPDKMTSILALREIAAGKRDLSLTTPKCEVGR